MRIESKLCHLSENKAVVQVNGWLNDKNIGSALAEGSTVEIAEDKAISRLNKRLSIIETNHNNININNDNKVNTEIKVELPKSVKIESDKINEEPSDWSLELTAIDSEVKRLDWSRDDEIEFLEKNYGYNNRNKITKYKELMNYLSKLKTLSNINTSNLKTQNVNNMIEESDLLLRDLSWDHTQGREYLQKEFNVSTRKDLDDKQLILFVSKLKSLRDQHFSK